MTTDLATMIVNDAMEMVSHRNLKQALFASAVSPRQRLDRNIRLAIALSKYVDMPLPDDRQELRNELRACKGMLFDSMINALYSIEAWYNKHLLMGDLDWYEHIGTTYAEQCEWRDKIVTAIDGIGYKCASFAALIYSPFTCLLIPVDVWHLKRLGYTQQSPSSSTMYKEIETRIYAEQSQETIEELQKMPIALYAWYKWLMVRGQGFISHAPLNGLSNAI